jgi:ubiquinol-cytochrome c reductase cytochrome c subunit
VNARAPGPLLVLASAIAAGTLLALAAQGRAHAQATPGSGAEAVQVALGRQLYVTGCSSCHGIEPTGTLNGPSLIDAGAASASFYLSTGRMPLNDPRQQPVRHRPAYSDAQIQQLVAYIASLGNGPPIPTVLPGHLSSGNQLFSLNCAPCHNDVGAGGALGYGYIVPPLRRATPLQVVEAIRVGPSPMPAFGPATLSDQQASDIAAYVQYLRRPKDRGGLGLGHIGPIAEGFVGWVVGMGLLLLATRLIGTRG